MPDQRAVNATSLAYWSAWGALAVAFDIPPRTDPEAWPLPEPEQCTAPQAAAIHRWLAAREALDVAQRRHTGARY